MKLKPIKRRKVHAGNVKNNLLYYIIVNKTKYYLKIGGTKYPQNALEVKVDKIIGEVQQKDGLYLSDFVVINNENYYLQW